jgi:hypothetical protein
MEGSSRLFVKNHVQLLVPKSASSWVVAWSKGGKNCCSERQTDRTTRQGHGGAMPRTACHVVNSKGFGDSRQRA